jgi:hypothetical protein
MEWQTAADATTGQHAWGGWTMARATFRNETNTVPMLLPAEYI